MKDIEKIMECAHKIYAYFEAIESLTDKMSGYDAYPIKALCSWGQGELIELQQISERVKNEK